MGGGGHKDTASLPSTLRSLASTTSSSDWSTTRPRWLPDIQADNEVAASEKFDNLYSALQQRALLYNDRPLQARLHYRNDILQRHASLPTAHNVPITMTGTTIVGVTGRDCVVLAADARATANRMVVDGTCRKLHLLTRTCAVAGAGTAADLQMVARTCRATARLHNRHYSSYGSSGGASSSSIVETLSDDFIYSAGIGNADDDDKDGTQEGAASVHALCHWIQSHLREKACEVALIVGGMDPTTLQPVLRAIHPNGSMDIVDFVAMGSGGPAALSILESARSLHHGDVGGSSTLAPHTDWTVDEAVALAVRAVQAGIDNDLGSGSYVDVCIIPRHGAARYVQRYTDAQELPPIPTATDADVAAVSNSDEKGIIEPVLAAAVGVNGFGNRPYSVQSRRMLRTHVGSGSDPLWSDILKP
jgi:20S proteasome subunit beta 2